MNNSMKKRFIRDFGLPIVVFESPYFEYFCDLYKNLFKVEERFSYLQELIDVKGGDDNALAFYGSLREQIIAKVKELPEYKEYNNKDMNELCKNNRKIKTKEVYQMPNAGKVFLSIDLKKANYQAMKFHSQALTFNTNSYEELITLFTDLQYFKESKYFRQVLFGNLNPKRQQSTQKHMMNNIVDVLLDSIPNITLDNFCNVSPDEVIIEYNDHGITLECDDNINLEQIAKEIPYHVHVDQFKLETIEDRKFFVKKYHDGSYEFKCVPAQMFAQVYKKYHDLPLHEYDTLFYHEKQLARFMNPIF